VPERNPDPPLLERGTERPGAIHRSSIGRAIQITRTGTQSTLSEDDVRALRAGFDASHCIRLPGLLVPDLLAALLERIERARFEERIHQGIGSNRELWMTDPTVAGIFHVLSNARPLYELAEAVSGCGPIGSFSGRVYRVVPGCGHHDAWHDDMTDGRLVAMSLNLSREPFQGGVLQIRDRATRRIIHQVANTGPGDAIVFRLSHELQHRITEIEGRAPKTAFAGWFRARPAFTRILGRYPPGRAPECP
jgi:2OG-Fe(II) oxygenase superfamily